MRPGRIKCRNCSVQFTGHISFKYCTNECKNAFRKSHPWAVRKEDRETKRLRRARYREKHREQGLCKHCIKPIHIGGRCFYHYRLNQKTDRIRKAKSNYGVLWEHQILLLTINDKIGALHESKIDSQQS